MSEVVKNLRAASPRAKWKIDAPTIMVLSTSKNAAAVRSVGGSIGTATSPATTAAAAAASPARTAGSRAVVASSTREDSGTPATSDRACSPSPTSAPPVDLLTRPGPWNVGPPGLQRTVAPLVRGSTRGLPAEPRGTAQLGGNRSTAARSAAAESHARQTRRRGRQVDGPGDRQRHGDVARAAGAGRVPTRAVVAPALLVVRVAGLVRP